jgi:hypothetical protein
LEQLSAAAVGAAIGAAVGAVISNNCWSSYQHQLLEQLLEQLSAAAVGAAIKAAICSRARKLSMLRKCSECSSMEIQQLILGFVFNSALDFYLVRLQHCGAPLTVVPPVCPSARIK